MSMTRNLILAFILIFIFLFIYQLFVFPPPHKPTAQTDTTAIVEKEKPEAQKVDTVIEQPQLGGEVTKPLNTVIDSLHVITPYVHMILDKRSGIILAYILPQYKFNGEPVNLIPDNAYWGVLRINGSLNWIEQDYPDTLFFNGSVQDSLVFKGVLGDSTYITKVIRFSDKPYVMTVTIRGLKSKGLEVFEPTLGVTQKDKKEDLRYFKFLVSETKLRNYSPKSLNNRRSFELKGVDWVGTRSKYFLFAVIPGTNVSRAFGTKMDENLIGLDIELSGNSEYTCYIGPLDYFLLKANMPILSNAYTFGNPIISPFKKLLIYGFRIFHGVIPNYGWVIVLFALIMKAVFWPLTRKSLKSMQKMQELKPKIDALRKIYKDDPKKMQEEMLALYRKYRVNPFSGCLPLLLQLPIFWALYDVLRTNIAFRGAGFVLWISDLSLKDPFYVLPILMGLTSFAQGYLQTGTQDQQSKMITMFMPIFLTVIFLNFPAGIVLYWLAYNVFSVAENLILKRFMSKEE